MVFKRTILSVCLAATLGMTTCPSAQARHVTSDPAANIMDALILVQDIAAVVLKVSDLAEFIKRNISNGDLGAVAGKLGMAESTKGVLEAAPITVPKELQNTAFASSTDDAEKMRNFVANELLPSSSSDELTDEEKEDRANKRDAVKKAAIADAYATSVAYLSKKANAEQEVVQPSMSSASSAETNHEKQAAANDVGIARLGELIEANILSAELLKLEAAEAMGSLPYDL